MQTLKEGIRNEIIRSAEHLFAEKGFFSTSMEMVARNAGVSKGNVYLYFKSKQILFETIISAALLETVTAFIIKRIVALLNPLDANQLHQVAGEELIRFLITNRMKVLILLNPENINITGTFRQKIVNESCKAYQEYCCRMKTLNAETDQEFQSTLAYILYDNIITTIGQILKIQDENVDHNALLQKLLCYHYNGMIAITH